MAAETSLDSKIYNTYVPLSVDIGRAHDIPKACTRLARTLAAAPLFDGRGSLVKKCKVIALSDWNDARICGLFNKNSRKLLEDMKPWDILDFGYMHNLVDSRGEGITQGIRLCLDDQVEMCSYEALEGAYKKVFSAIISGWEKADLKDHPNILHKENPEEFDLFIKDKVLLEEDSLIRFIVGKFSLEDNVKCHTEWLTPSGGYCYNDKIYLWVRKTERESAVEKIGFKLDRG